MGMIIGAGLGYLLGRRFGGVEPDNIRSSWHTIADSQEVRGALASALMVGAGLVQRAAELAAGQLQSGGGQNLRRAS